MEHSIYLYWRYTGYCLKNEKNGEKLHKTIATIKSQHCLKYICPPHEYEVISLIYLPRANNV